MEATCSEHGRDPCGRWGTGHYDDAVTDHDSAFLWETEALRTAARTRRSGAGRSTPVLDGGDWLTLREASEVTGVPTNTLRKWARHENVPSYLEKTEDGHLRMVSLDGIERWAAKIDRDLDPRHPGDGDVLVDVTADRATEQRRAVDPELPEGSMLVPLDAWNKVLNQLGNLHEAGQQLAEARERAAKAETEARFLKERLAEMRSELEQLRGQERIVQPDTDVRTEDAGTPASTLGGTATTVARKLYEGWRKRWGI